jgi:ComF family protein
MHESVRQWFASLYRCVLCADRAQAHNLCAACAHSLPTVAHACARCALPLAAPGSLCGACLLHTPAWDDAASAFAYRFPVDRLITATKFHGRLDMACALAHASAARLVGDRPVHADAIVPVPLHWRRRWRRGFNQATQLAAPVARAAGIELQDRLLQRLRATREQTRLDAQQRHDNLADAFVTRAAVTGKRLILFDDVLTTGATLNAAADALKRAGAAHVRVWTCARAAVTPVDTG